MALLERKGLSDFVWRQVIGNHPGVVELLPLLIGEVENFGLTHGEWDDQSVRQLAEFGQQASLAEIDCRVSHSSAVVLRGNLDTTLF